MKRLWKRIQRKRRASMKNVQMEQYREQRELEREYARQIDLDIFTHGLPQSGEFRLDGCDRLWLEEMGVIW